MELCVIVTLIEISLKYFGEQKIVSIYFHQVKGIVCSIFSFFANLMTLRNTVKFLKIWSKNLITVYLRVSEESVIPNRAASQRITYLPWSNI
jgi:hypothetical protein